MVQGLLEAQQTYARLKNFVVGPVAPPYEELTLGQILESAFENFINDDFEAQVSAKAQMEFLEYFYFPRLHWSKMSLKPGKCGF